MSFFYEIKINTYDKKYGIQMCVCVFCIFLFNFATTKSNTIIQSLSITNLSVHFESFKLLCYRLIACDILKGEDENLFPSQSFCLHSLTSVCFKESRFFSQCFRLFCVVSMANIQC